jgi:hypothetical protein
MVLTGIFSALTNTKMKFRFPQNAWNLLTSWGTVSFSRRSVLCGVNYAVNRYIKIVWPLFKVTTFITWRINHTWIYQFKSWIRKDLVPVRDISLFTYGPGWSSRYSNSLGTGRSGDRIPVGARFSAPVQTGLGAHTTLHTK